jgi:hypothetical protein
MTNSVSFPHKANLYSKIRRVLQTDPVITAQQLEHRNGLIAARVQNRPSAKDWFELLQKAEFACTERSVKTSVGARVSSVEQFICASKRVAALTDWNLRQLAGLAALRYGLGIPAEHWQLRALERTNLNDVAIPDAMIYESRANKPKARFDEYGKFQGLRPISPTSPEALVAVEWDSGSATRTELTQKIQSYRLIAAHQIWAVPTLARAETILDLLKRELPNRGLMVIAVDWRTGKLIRLMLPHRGTGLEQVLTRVMPVDATWRIA